MYGGDPFANLGPVDEFGDFTPFTLDVSPLQRFLITLARQVRGCLQAMARVRCSKALCTRNKCVLGSLFIPVQVEQLQKDNAALREELNGLKVRAEGILGPLGGSVRLVFSSVSNFMTMLTCLEPPQIDKRLETLEQGLQELAENTRPGTGYANAAGGAGFGQVGLRVWGAAVGCLGSPVQACTQVACHLVPWALKWTISHCGISL